MLNNLFFLIGKITMIQFVRTEVMKDGSCIEDPEQIVTLKANVIISAFGSTASQDIQLVKSLEPLQFTSSGCLEVDKNNMTTKLSNVFAGGDIAGVSETTVEAVNDGKTAAWSIHNFIQVFLI